MCRFSCNFQFKRRQALLSFVSGWLTTRRLGNRNWEHLVICFSGHNSRNGAATDRAVAVEMKASQPNFFFFWGRTGPARCLRAGALPRRKLIALPFVLLILSKWLPNTRLCTFYINPPTPPTKLIKVSFTQ